MSSILLTQTGHSGQHIYAFIDDQNLTDFGGGDLEPLFEDDFVEDEEYLGEDDGIMFSDPKSQTTPTFSVEPTSPLTTATFYDPSFLFFDSPFTDTPDPSGCFKDDNDYTGEVDFDEGDISALENHLLLRALEDSCTKPHHVVLTVQPSEVTPNASFVPSLASAPVLDEFTGVPPLALHYSPPFQSRKPSSLEASLLSRIQNELPKDQLSGVLRIIHGSDAMLSENCVIDLTSLQQSKLLELYEYVAQCMSTSAAPVSPSSVAHSTSPSSSSESTPASHSGSVSPSLSIADASTPLSVSPPVTPKVKKCRSTSAQSKSSKRATKASRRANSKRGSRRSSAHTSEAEDVVVLPMFSLQKPHPVGIIFEENSDEEIDVVGL